MTDIDLVTKAAADVPDAVYPGGWPGQVEAALIDAVLSIQAKYGREDTGVRRCIRRYRESHAGRVLDDLTVLADLDPARLADILNNHQSTGGVPKSDAIVSAAKSLVAAGVKHAVDFDVHNLDQKRAYTSVKGLGPVTWEYCGMNLGQPGVKADTWICRFVAQAIGRPVESAEARGLVMEAAVRLGKKVIELDYSIWFLMSGGKAAR
jgi:hypothetical protein